MVTDNLDMAVMQQKNSSNNATSAAVSTFGVLAGPANLALGNVVLLAPELM